MPSPRSSSPRSAAPDAHAAPGERDRLLVEQACRRLEGEPPVPGLEALAQLAGLSAWHFHRLFKRVLGVTPKQYADAHRMQRFQAQLQGGAPVTQAMFDAGFGATSRAQAHSLGRLGMPASTARRGGQGEHITYGVARSQLGWVVVGATARGVCAIEFIEQPDGGAAQLQARYPQALFTPADDGLSALTQQVVDLIDQAGQPGAEAAARALPLDIRGTAFQQKVWQALRGIPPGLTISYAELARRIGQPTAARAVARACATNPLAVAVPCHRVVGSGGSLTGYRWGVPLKAALLAREQAGWAQDTAGRQESK
jgi:AraC family transcriptional regulator of adaptative response/methylated-DNA-[protein]-cysteine methyltransferase